MKKAVFFVLFSSLTLSGFSETARVSYIGNYSRASTASRNQVSMSSIKDKPDTQVSSEVDKREKEKNACISNNIGTSNTFVWASKFSNPSNYSSMIEDTKEPNNNVCFVRVELKSADKRIKLDDVPPVYYEMGRNIVCGSWVNEEKMEKKILDAKETARIWGTVAGSVGGAGVGVGSMELFGNKLIGGKVEGQKALNDNELLRSQLLVLKEKDNKTYQEFIANIKELKSECDKLGDKRNEVEACNEFDFDTLLKI